MGATQAHWKCPEVFGIAPTISNKSKFEEESTRPTSHFACLWVISAVLLSGCSYHITSSQVKHLISSYPQFATLKYFPISDETARNFEKDGLYTSSGFQGEARRYFPVKTPLGYALLDPIPREVVSIDGVPAIDNIAEDQEVLFTYRFADVPPFISKYVYEVTGTYYAIAFFKHDDHGWRIDAMRCTFETQKENLGHDNLYPC